MTLLNHVHFVQEIRSNPLDAVPRLVYADYLEECGDPRAELIRTQVELRGLPAETPRRAELQATESRLLAEFGEQWLAPLRSLGAAGITERCFQGGLIERVRLTVEKLFESGAELCEREPALHQLDIRNPQSELARLVQYPLPAQITSLDLTSNRLTAEHMAILGAAPWWSQIRELSLQFNQLGDAGTRRLAQFAFGRLRVLQLGANRIGPEGVRAIARSATLADLTQLGLNVNQAGDLGVRFLAREAVLSKLAVLDLSANAIGEEGAVELARSTRLPALRQLSLRGNRIPESAAEALNQAQFPHLRELDVRGNKLAGRLSLPSTVVVIAN